MDRSIVLELVPLGLELDDIVLELGVAVDEDAVDASIALGLVPELTDVALGLELGVALE